MMEVSADISLHAGDALQRERAKERLYLLFQLFGWGAWMAIETLTSLAFPDPDDRRPLSTLLCFIVMCVASGLLISHYMRPLMARWRWKQLGWRPLLPRLIGASVAAAVLWTVFNVGWVHGIIGEQWHTKYAPVLLVSMDICYVSMLF